MSNCTASKTVEIIWTDALDHSICIESELVNIKKQSPARKSPGKKKRSWRWAPRDSLNRRTSVGTPGSRKYNRLLNEFFLYNLAEDLNAHFDQSDSDLYAQGPSVFAELFEDENKMRAWQEFIELPEDVQEEIIYKSESKPAITPKSSSKDISPEESWRRIHRPTRQLLRRCKDTDFLTKFDSEIYILLSEYIGPLQQTFTFEHISDLYIATGVCDLSLIHI
eukprot:TRINITY_DN5312_c0_g1_i4.p1 TRINITY_DN5312_c0_g1~~TRINITY_DN5312_c0_g1_i4.p1  ORF type:complete len:222 (-),score=25.15 TRINITY_DN5312_c0_g1_i4:24-689(-)